MATWLALPWGWAVSCGMTCVAIIGLLHRYSWDHCGVVQLVAAGLALPWSWVMAAAWWPSLGVGQVACVAWLALPWSEVIARLVLRTVGEFSWYGWQP